jgi:hypothetical protein
MAMKSKRFAPVLTGMMLAFAATPSAHAQLGGVLGFVKRVFGIDAKLEQGFTAGPLQRPIPLGPIIFTSTTIQASLSSVTISSQATFKGIPVCRASLEVTTRGLTLTCPVNMGVTSVQFRGSMDYNLKNWQLSAVQNMAPIGSATIRLGSDGFLATATYLGISLTLGPVKSLGDLPGAVAKAVANLLNPVALVKNVVSGAMNVIGDIAGFLGRIGRAIGCKLGTCIEQRHVNFIKDKGIPSGIVLVLNPNGTPNQKGFDSAVRTFLSDKDPNFDKVKLEDWDQKGLNAIAREIDEGVREGWMRTDRWYSYGRGCARSERMVCKAPVNREQFKGIPPPWQVLAWHVGGSGRGKGGRYPLTEEQAFNLLQEKARRIRLTATASR